MWCSGHVPLEGGPWEDLEHAGEITCLSWDGTALMLPPDKLKKVAVEREV